MAGRGEFFALLRLSCREQDDHEKKSEAGHGVKRCVQCQGADETLRAIGQQTEGHGEEEEGDRRRPYRRVKRREQQRRPINPAGDVRVGQPAPKSSLDEDVAGDHRQHKKGRREGIESGEEVAILPALQDLLNAVGTFNQGDGEGGGNGRIPAPFPPAQPRLEDPAKSTFFVDGAHDHGRDENQRPFEWPRIRLQKQKKRVGFYFARPEVSVENFDPKVQPEDDQRNRQPRQRAENRVAARPVLREAQLVGLRAAGGAEKCQYIKQEQRDRHQAGPQGDASHGNAFRRLGQV